MGKKKCVYVKFNVFYLILYLDYVYIIFCVFIILLRLLICILKKKI